MDKSPAGLPGCYAHNGWEYSGLLYDYVHAISRLPTVMSSKIHEQYVINKQSLRQVMEYFSSMKI